LADSAYLDGLRLLSRRELSEAQVRTRLARKGHDPGDVEDAVSRLQREGALDDARTAAAIARTQVSIKRFGPRRVRRDIEAAGIAEDVAAAAVAAVFDGTDPAATVDDELTRRLGASDLPIDDRLAARLYRRLVAHGHDPELVSRVIRSRRRAAMRE
jgi:regulatory protein